MEVGYLTKNNTHPIPACMTFNASEMTHHEEEGCGLRPFPDDPSQAWKWGAQPALWNIVDHSQTYESEKVGWIYLLYYILNVKTQSFV